MRAFFSSLSKTQLLVFTFLLLGTAISVSIGAFYGYQEMLGKDSDIYRYEAWDPSNKVTIADKINNLNQKGEKLNEELTILIDYREELTRSISLLKTLQKDSFSAQNVRETLARLQPYYVIYPTALKPDPLATDNPKTYKYPFIKKVAASGSEFTSIYRQLINDVGYRVQLFSTDRQNLWAYEIYETDLEVRPTNNPNSNYYYGLGPDTTTVPRDIINKKFHSAIEKFIFVTQNIDTPQLSYRIAEIKKQIPELNQQLEKYQSDYLRNRVDINKYAVLIGIPLFILSALLMYFYGIYNSNKLRDQLTSKDKFDHQSYKTGLSFTLFSITVLLLILTLLILGLASVIQENTLAALLGTIAGYVLNTATDKGGQNTTVNGAAPDEPAAIEQKDESNG